MSETPLVLIATTNPLPAAALRDALGAEAMVQWVPDGLEVLGHLVRQTPQLVLLAADLPGLPGLQVCQTIKGIPELERLPVVLLHQRGYRMEELLASDFDANLHLTVQEPEDLVTDETLAQLRTLLALPALEPLTPERSAMLALEMRSDRLLPTIANELKDTLIERAILRALAVASTKLHDLESLLRELMLLCGDVLEFSRAGLYIYETRTLYTLHPSGSPEVDARFSEAMIEQAGIFGGLRDFSGETTERSLGEFTGADLGAEEGPGTFFAVPLMGDEEAIGVIGVNTLKAFSRRDYYLRTLGMLAQQTALALATALLYQRVQNLSRTDELTQLYNRRAFFEKTQDELVRRRRFKKPLTVLLTDIDHFKKVNDTYGHQQGDWVLKETAQIFRDCIRSIDVPGRIGGEEFTVLLPETNAEGGMIAAERLRTAIEEFQFTPVEGDEPLRCTISIGVVTIDGETETSVDDLIAAADKGLYEAKESGRNRVIPVEFGPKVAT